MVSNVSLSGVTASRSEAVTESKDRILVSNEIGSARDLQIGFRSGNSSPRRMSFRQAWGPSTALLSRERESNFAQDDMRLESENNFAQDDMGLESERKLAQDDMRLNGG